MSSPETRVPAGLAAALGALAAVLAVAFPFLPVHQDTLELRWPTAGRPDAVRGSALHWGWETAGPQGDPPPGRPGVGR